MAKEPTIEMNYYPVGVEPQNSSSSGMAIDAVPKYNAPSVMPEASNVVPAPNGVIMAGGQMQSPNYATNVSGWIIRADGSVEFDSGYFRGDITGASGTFSGTVAASAIDIGGSDSTSFHVDSAGNMWLGSATFAGAPFSVSNTGDLIASSATITGYSIQTKGTYGGDGTDGALAITSGTTTIDCSSAKLVVKNYTSISITGTGTLAFSNPHSTGTVVILKSQGNVTLTSSSAPMIDCRGMGANGGAGYSSSTPGAAGNGTTGSNSSIYSFSGVSNAGEGGKATTASGGAALTISYPSGTASTIVSRYPHIFVGAGGGGGGGVVGAGGGSVTGGTGGKGGGALIIECGNTLNFTTSGGISVAGNAGTNGTGSSNYFVGGGGGGGTGMCIITYNALTAASGTITTTGGAGGTGGFGGSVGAVRGAGGGGGNYQAGSNSQDPTANQLTGGDGAAGVSVVELNTIYS